MKAKGWITFLMALLALAVSLFSSYLQFFHKSDRLKALVIEFRPDGNERYIAQIAFINQGNQPATINRIQLVFLHPFDRTFALVPQVGQGRMAKAMPIVVGPGEVALRNVAWDCYSREFLSSHIKYLWSKGDQVWFTVKIRFSVIDSSGKRHTVDYNACKILVTEDKMGTTQCRPKPLNLLTPALGGWHIPFIERYLNLN